MPNWVFDISHRSSICGRRAPLIASTENANCEQRTNKRKLTKTLEEENKGSPSRPISSCMLDYLSAFSNRLSELLEDQIFLPALLRARSGSSRPEPNVVVLKTKI